MDEKPLNISRMFQAFSFLDYSINLTHSIIKIHVNKYWQILYEYKNVNTVLYLDAMSLIKQNLNHQHVAE